MKNNDKVYAFVYVTNDYSKFKKLERNRGVKGSRLQKLIASFSVKAILCPIIVNKRFEIIDGQGRYEACKAMGLPIYYAIDANATIDDCMRMNHYNTPWTTVDFARSYAEGGNANYIRLLAILEELKIPMRRALRLANKANGKFDDLVQSGELNFSSDDMMKVRKIMEFANKLIGVFMMSPRCADTFYTGCSVMMMTDGFDQAKMLKNAEKERSQFMVMSRLEDMLKEFSRVYNRGVRQCDRLYFEDYMRNRGSNARSYDTSYFGMEDLDVSTLKRRGK